MPHHSNTSIELISEKFGSISYFTRAMRAYISDVERIVYVTARFFLGTPVPYRSRSVPQIAAPLDKHRRQFHGKIRKVGGMLIVHCCCSNVSGFFLNYLNIHHEEGPS